MALPPEFTATTKSPWTVIPLELDELLDELDELEDELLELDELELLELEELLEPEELEELLELEELELLLEPVLPPPQPTNQKLVATSASDKTRFFVISLFMMLITLLEAISKMSALAISVIGSARLIFAAASVY